jgi:Flp pilus assembly protein TadB
MMNATAFGIFGAAAAIVVMVAMVLLYVLYVGAREERRIRGRILGPDAREEFSDVGANWLVQSAARRGREMEKATDKKGETPLLLARAGWRVGRARMWFYAAQILAPMGGVALAMFLGLAGLLGSGLARPFALGLILVIVAALAPRWVLRRAAKARVERIRSEVPLLVNVLIMLFEAGLSTRQALTSLVRDGADVVRGLAPDLEMVVRQLEAGGELGEVLDGYARQMDIPDLTTILSLLRQVDRYGGEVRQPLTEALEVIEKRRELELRERVNILAGRMTVVMVAFFFPALLIFVAAPAFITFISAFSRTAG